MTATTTTGARVMRIAAILAIALLAFVASYRIANAGGTTRTAGPGSLAPQTAAAPGADAPACACCGGAGSGETVEGSAALEGDVQRITVDTSAGYYNPNVINLAAGVPAEITFTQASGCLAQVMSQDLGFFEDLTAGDATVRLEGLQPGTYEFSCGMQMVFGSIVVK